MRRFVLRLSCFTVLVVAIIGGASVAEILAEVLAYRKEVAAPDGASVLVCNDSQLQRSVDPSICPQFFNFCASGRMLDQAYLTMLDVLDAPANRGRIRQVVFDVSPESLVWRVGLSIGELGYPAQYYQIYFRHPKEAREFRGFDGWLRVVRDNLVGDRFRLAWKAIRGRKPFRSSLAGGFNYSSEVGMERPERFARSVEAKVQRTLGYEKVREGDFAYRVLGKVVAAAKARGVELVFVTTPWHEDLIRACGDEAMTAFERRLAAFAARHNCRYLDFLREPFPDAAWMDANHLNATGAKLFTKRLADHLGGACRGER